MVSFQNLCECEGINFDDYWKVDFDVELYYFIGKDIINFYGLFWFVMLDGVGLCKFIVIFSYGFVIVNGVKMFKFCGIFIMVCIYLDYLDLEYLCYYFVVKLNSWVDDFDFNLEDFVQCVNIDLVGKVVNIVSCIGNFVKKFGGCFGDDLDNLLLVCEVQEVVVCIVVFYEQCEFSKVMCEIMSLVDYVNGYIVDKVFWSLVKEDGKEDEVLVICIIVLNVFCLLVLYLKLVLLGLVECVEVFLDILLFIWVDVDILLINYLINKFKLLLLWVDMMYIEVMLVDFCDINFVVFVKVILVKDVLVEEDDIIIIDDFFKVKLCVVCIVKVVLVEGVDKLL